MKDAVYTEVNDYLIGFGDLEESKSETTTTRLRWRGRQLYSHRTQHRGEIKLQRYLYGLILYKDVRDARTSDHWQPQS